VPKPAQDGPAVRRLVDDWAPPALRRTVRRLRNRRASARSPATVANPAVRETGAPQPAPAQPASKPNTATRWEALTRRALDGLESCDPIYRPTSFWGPGVTRLLDDMSRIGIEAFKTWPTAFFWFYPTYPLRLPEASAQRVATVLRRHGTEVNDPALASSNSAEGSASSASS
jgi:hypothetical protein